MFVARKKESVVYNVHCGSILSLVALVLVQLVQLHVQAWIHTGFHRFMEIGQIFHSKHLFNIIIELSKLKSGKWSQGQCFLFPISGHLMPPQ